MTGASVLLVGLEAAIKFSRHITIIRSGSLNENDGEYERNGVTDATLKPGNINNTVGIAYLRALCDGYCNSRT